MLMNLNTDVYLMRNASIISWCNYCGYELLSLIDLWYSIACSINLITCQQMPKKTSRTSNSIVCQVHTHTGWHKSSYKPAASPHNHELSEEFKIILKFIRLWHSWPWVTPVLVCGQWSPSVDGCMCVVRVSISLYGIVPDTYFVFLAFFFNYVNL